MKKKQQIKKPVNKTHESALSALKLAVARLNNANIKEAELDAKYMVAHVLGVNPQTIYLNKSLTLNKKQQRTSNRWVKQRINGKPVQYILGEQDFYGLTFKVSKAVLIPRSETELLVEKALEKAKAKNAPTVLDLCTGSGCIAVAVKHNCTNADVSASDISAKALRVATFNASANNTDIHFYHSDLLRSINGTFDLIISNPPYISQKDYVNLGAKVKSNEPKGALLAGQDGLSIIKQLIPQCYAKLNADGWLMMEIGYDQKQAVEALLKKYGFSDIKTFSDYSDFDRIVVGKKSN